jgi:hypothetical protein
MRFRWLSRRLRVANSKAANGMRASRPTRCISNARCTLRKSHLNYTASGPRVFGQVKRQLLVSLAIKQRKSHFTSPYGSITLRAYSADSSFSFHYNKLWHSRRANYKEHTTCLSMYSEKLSTRYDNLLP